MRQFNVKLIWIRGEIINKIGIVYIEYVIGISEYKSFKIQNELFILE